MQIVDLQKSCLLINMRSYQQSFCMLISRNTVRM